MRFVLKMNGTTDKLEIPQFQFDKVILDIMVTKKSSWGKYWSSNYGWFQRNSNGINDQWDTGIIEMVYKNNIPQINLTPFVNIGERAVFTIKLNKIINSKSFIFANMGAVHTGGEIYNIKYYLGGTLQAHYDINTGTVKDQSGNGFDGILTGGTWIDNYIKIARLRNDGKLLIKGEVIEKDKEIITPYLEFGGNGTVTVPHNNIFNITDAITISARIKITDTSETNYGQFMTKGNAFAWFLGVRRTDGYTVWYSKMNSGLNNNWAIRDYRELLDGHWHNIVFSYDKDAGENNQRLYIDGVLKNQRTTLGTFDTTTNPISLVTSSFKGGFRDARIYNRQLTDNEVVDLFEEKSVTEGLVGHWVMNEGTGNIAYDSSPNSNNGAIVGALWKEDIEQVDKISQFRPNGDLIVYGQLVEGTKASIKTGTLARNMLVHRYIHQGNKVIQPTGLNKATGLFTTTEPIALAPGTKRQVITAFNYQSDGSIPREWRGVDAHFVEVVDGYSFYIRRGSANGEILTYTNANNNLVDVNSFRFEYDFRNYQVDLSEYNIKKGKFNFKGTRHRPGWSYIYLNVNHSGGNHQHSYGTFADGRDYLSLDITGLFSIEDDFVSARIENYIKTEWNDSNGTWVNYQGSNGNVLNQSFDNPSFGILSFSYAMANGSVIEIYEIEMDNELEVSELAEGGV